MNGKFDPAPHDKHADKPGDPASRDRDELDAALADSFPASDPASPAQPAPSKPRRKADKP
jgi:hypothetical protein